MVCSLALHLVHDFVFCGADFCWCWLCWLYWFGCLFAEYMFLDLCCGLMLFFFNSRFVQFSSILLDKVEAFAIAFSISSVLFSVRLVSVSNHFCNFVEVQLHITGSLILSSVSLPHSQCKANSHSPVTKCLIHYLNFCSALWNAERSKGYLL